MCFTGISECRCRTERQPWCKCSTTVHTVLIIHISVYILINSIPVCIWKGRLCTRGVMWWCCSDDAVMQLEWNGYVEVCWLLIVLTANGNGYLQASLWMCPFVFTPGSRVILAYTCYCCTYCCFGSSSRTRVTAAVHTAVHTSCPSNAVGLQHLLYY